MGKLFWCQEAIALDFTPFRAQIPALSDRVYLNTGTSGPVPQSSLEAEIGLLRQIAREGYASPPAMMAYSRALVRAKEAIASVLSCDAASIALVNSTSDGISIVAAGLDWQPGDEVIISDLEHISGVAPWRRLAVEKGIIVRNLESHGGALDAQTILDAITPKTRLICISHVSYATGALLPVEEVCAQARERGVLVVVDGAQSAGQLPIDVRRIQCDFYALPGQKWLLGPEGTGALYVAPEALETIRPTRIGWASVIHEGGGASPDGVVQLHPDARRFETGTVHASAFAGLTQSIDLLSRYGWEAIFERARSLAAMARVRLSELPGVRILSPKPQPTGLLTFAVDGADHDAIVKRLWSQRRIVIRSIPYPSALRASFHAFNDEADVGALVSAISDVVQA